MSPERIERITSVLNHRQPDLTVVMENVHDPHNIAAVMRTCDSVGIQEIYVLNTIKPRHIMFDRKRAAGVVRWLTVHQFNDTEACMQAVKAKYKNIFATHLGEKAVSLYELDLTEPVALVFGNEHDGVTEECLKHCTGNFIIPQVGMVKSLNISVACAVTLYEAYRQKSMKGMYDGKIKLPEEEIQMLTKKWGMTEDTE